MVEKIDFAGEVLILTGPPGSGKTTTARALANAPGSPKVHLHADDFWHFIKHGAVAPYLPKAHAQNGTVIGVLAQATAGYGKGGYFVVLDGIVGPWFLAPFRDLGVAVHYVVLRPPLETAIQRCQQRGGNTLTDPEPIIALYHQLSALGEFERYVVRTVGQNPEETLDAVVGSLGTGAHRLSS